MIEGLEGKKGIDRDSGGLMRKKRDWKRRVKEIDWRIWEDWWGRGRHWKGK